MIPVAYNNSSPGSVHAPSPRGLYISRPVPSWNALGLRAYDHPGLQNQFNAQY